MRKFTLFRLKLYVPSQRDWSKQDVSTERVALLRRIILRCPEETFRKGVVWHIGNAQEVNHRYISFSFGRTSNEEYPVWDTVNKIFMKMVGERSPNTLIILNPDLGVACICHNSDLYGDCLQVAKNLRSLLLRNQELLKYDVSVDVDPIYDPTEFIPIIEDSYVVRSFTFFFKKPNPTDVGAFLGRSSDVVDDMNGEIGSTTISSKKDLAREPIVKFTKSCASTGDEAKVKVKRQKGDGITTWSMKENRATFSVDELCSDEEIAYKMMALYNRIRDSL